MKFRYRENLAENYIGFTEITQQRNASYRKLEYTHTYVHIYVYISNKASHALTVSCAFIVIIVQILIRLVDSVYSDGFRQRKYFVFIAQINDLHNRQNATGSK